MASNQAAYLDGQGQKLRISAADMPKPGSDEILIRNRAVAVNPIDWKIQDMGMMVQKWPTVLGMDVAGEVVETGADAGGRFKKGDRVVSRLVAMLNPDNQHGAFQHYCLASINLATKIPDSVSFIDASVLPVAFETALTGLSASDGKGLGLPSPSLDPKPSGKTVVVWGGSSSVGALTIQVAVAAGMKVIATSSKRNFDFCKKCGATDVFDYSDSSVVENVINAVKRSGGEFSGVYDTVSFADSYKASTTIVERFGGGALVTTVPGLPEAPTGVKNIPVFGLGPFTHSFWKEYVTPALEQGSLKCLPEPMVVGQGLEKLQEAFDLQKKGVSAKKVVVTL